MVEIHIDIADKVPVVIGNIKCIVADNSDYTMRFTFDEQWDQTEKTVYFVLDNGYAYAPVVLKDNKVTLPRIVDGTSSKCLYVGVQQGKSHTSCACAIPICPAITDIIDDEAVQPAPAMWEDLMARLEHLEQFGGSGEIKNETDPTVPDWAKQPDKPSYSKSEVGLGNVDNVKQYSASNPPPYPVTSINGKTGAVTLGAGEVGAATAEQFEQLSKEIADKTRGSKVYYAICETPGESNPKMAYTVTRDFVLERGARVGVWFKYNNIGAQNLNVDDTGAFQWISARKSDGTIVSDTPTMYKAGGQLHWFTFDGEYWIVDDSIRAGEDTVGKVSLSQIRTEAEKNHYTKTEIDNKFSALDTALAEAIGSGVVS